jgi:hypothetical protein
VVSVTETTDATLVVEGAVVAAVDDDDLGGELAVTVLVTPEAALALAQADERGTLAVLLAPPEAGASAAR